MTRALLERALEALENALSDDKPYIDSCEKASELIRAHLAKPDTAPAWKDAPTCDGQWVRVPGYECGCDLMYIAGNYIPPEGVRWFGPIPEDK